jgi:hypothetical protein
MTGRDTRREEEDEDGDEKLRCNNKSEEPDDSNWPMKRGRILYRFIGGNGYGDGVSEDIRLAIRCNLGRTTRKYAALIG